MKSRVLTSMLTLLIVVVLALPLARVSAHDGAHARFANLAPTLGPVDIYVGTEVFAKALKYKDATDFLAIEGFDADLSVVPAGGKPEEALIKPTKTHFAQEQGAFFTVAVVGSAKDSTLELVVLPGEKGADTGAAATVGSATAGNIKITGAWVRATASADKAAATPDAMSGMSMGTPAAMSGMDMGSGATSAGYMVIENTGDKADKLITVESDDADALSLHKTEVKNDIAQMIPLPDGLDIPAKGSVELKPGGYHIMIEKLKEDFVVGGTAHITLTFQSGIKVTVEAEVRASS